MKVHISCNKALALGITLYIPLCQIRLFADVEIATIGNIMLIMLLLISYMRGIRQIDTIQPKKTFILFVISMFILEFSVHWSSVSIGKAANILIYGLLVLLIPFFLKYDEMLRYYNVVGFFATLLIYIQFVQIYILKVVPIHFEMTLAVDRPSSFFTEPQAYASYIVFLLIFSLKKRDYLIFLFHSIGVFMSTSSLGIFMTVFIWISFIIFYSSRTIKQILIKVCIILCLSIGIFVFINTSAFGYAFNKLTEIDIFSNIRIIRGFWTYITLPFFNKIFGVGFYNIENFLNMHNVYLWWIEGSTIPEYITSMAAILVYFGVIPFIILWIFLIQMFMEKNFFIFFLTALICIMMISQTALFNAWFVYIWSMFFSFYYNEKNMSQNSPLYVFQKVKEKK